MEGLRVGEQRRTEFHTVKAHSVVPTHIVFLPSFYHLSTDMRKCTRPSPALPHCKRQEAGWGPGNKAKQFANCILLYNFYYEILAICSYPRLPQWVVFLCMNSSPQSQPLPVCQWKIKRKEKRLVKFITGKGKNCHLRNVKDRVNLLSQQNMLIYLQKFFG